MLQLKRSAALGLMLAFFAGVGTMTPASAQNVAINVNGQTVNFDQPPIERVNRIRAAALRRDVQHGIVFRKWQPRRGG